MKSKALVLLMLGLIVPGICAAQSIRSGTWSGTVTPPGEEQAMPVTFDVTVHTDSLGIVLHAGEHGDFALEKGRYAEGKITFTFNPGGPQVSCILARNEEGAFTGPCLGDDGSEAKMTMVPPKE